MGLDIDDFYVERIHRLGSLRRARAISQTPRRPIIVAFGQYRNTNTILETAYMLRGSDFSVSRDLPKEILNARKNLMPKYKQQKQNRGNKVTLEYPAKLIVNGQVIADGFPDWHRYMQTDRYDMLKPNNAQATVQTSTEHDLETRQNTNSQFREANVGEQRPPPPHYQPTPQPQPQPQFRPTTTPDNTPGPIQNVNMTNQVRPAVSRTYAQTAQPPSHDVAVTSLAPPQAAASNIPRYTNAGNQASNGQQVDSNHHGPTNNMNNQDGARVNGTHVQPSYRQL